MRSKRDMQILKNIIKYCERIQDVIDMFGGTLEALEANHVYQSSASMYVLQIGELTTHLTTEFTKSNPRIPWKEIRKMRNIAAHHYERFNMKKLYDTIMADVPELRDYCQKLLDAGVVVGV